MNPGVDPGVEWTALHRAACEPYRAAGRFAWHFARGKLGRDPVFRFLVERRLFDVAGRGGADAPLRVLDVGCGQGLVASLLGALGGLPHAIGAVRYTGIDLMPRDIERARGALGNARAARFVCADMRDAAFPRCDVAVILDVLHYVDPDVQRRVVERVRDALGGRGRLLLRVGDQAAGRGFAISQWVDRAVTRLRGHRVAPTWGRPLAAWRELLEGVGFRIVDAVPMSRGTPFANVLLVADLGGNDGAGA